MQKRGRDIVLIFTRNQQLLSSSPTMKRFVRLFHHSLSPSSCGHLALSSSCLSSVLRSAEVSYCITRYSNHYFNHTKTHSNRGIHSNAALCKEDYYQILGIPRTADAKEIKKAYYDLAKKYHPDRNPDNPEAAKKFTKIGEAYEVLSNSEKRKRYDYSGFSEFSDEAGPGHQGNPFTSMRAEEIFRQFFGDFDMFGQDIFGQDARNSQTLHLSLSFMESVKGCSKELSMRVQAMCERCSGSGGEPGTKTEVCPYCRGSGEEVISTGFFKMKSVCRNCHGQGRVITVRCRSCMGKGTTVKTRSVNVQVPAGVSDGQTLRVPVGHTEAYVTLRVSSSDTFRRDGFDIHSDANVSYTQAVLGGVAKTPGLNGTLDLKIPAGIQSHHRLRLSGRGIPRLNGYGNGDHYIHIRIKVPKNLTSEQKTLIEELAQTEDYEGSVNGIIKGRGENGKKNKLIKKEKGFLQKLKGIFWEDEDKEQKENTN
ncbi:PREDICTED: dnaJ homolog subfamily A member 3, mitochondrial-like isoform X1 [Amphimedon queenslandica]|uniref:Uncharacterized protein n=1 Tax=Amphimedon queenslandica TaxID=400682 RepID=A0A1X7V3F9_AMPQE|nr:PREDICTED: dnaJ homolog subfamily A member 3, mitochondrial-like isoform X1 [Amphimedon queenslandica]XP_019850860.1 PREDICTED: dnaJ homolog subfamily A member 3, mitochondrial-like isoform X1 [Amphimedon queenslandica]|eukprot:XP_019850859.1 PREDICTED: dnaJ homolog subfamily A member 3, mitochondrial-like isoform X1 [Amphimedon queenslandica]